MPVSSIDVKDATNTTQTINTLPSLGQAAKSASLPVTLASDQPVLAPTVAKGYVQITSLSSATNLGTIPSGATRAIIAVSGQDVRFRDDGTNPTATVGFPLSAGAIMTYDGTLSALVFIQQSASATLDVCFYGYS